MAKFDENQLYLLILEYYNAPSSRANIIHFFLRQYQTAIESEQNLQKIKLERLELQSEAVQALLDAFEVAKAKGSAVDFEKGFMARIRAEFRKYTSRKTFVDIAEVSITDPNPNPEEAFILKEQMEMIAEFLLKHYSPDVVEQFMKRYAEGRTLREISNEYGYTEQSIAEKLDQMLQRTRKYMVRMTNG